MKRVLFVCIENSCRSQMAEGFARKYGKGVIEACSAGSNPSGTVNPYAVQVMKEEGVDISGARAKGFCQLSLKEVDYAITLGCKDVCPFVPARNHREWDIEDPKNKGIDSFRKSRDKIKEKILEFIREIRKV